MQIAEDLESGKKHEQKHFKTWFCDMPPSQVEKMIFRVCFFDLGGFPRLREIPSGKGLIFSL